MKQRGTSRVRWRKSAATPDTVDMATANGTRTPPEEPEPEPVPLPAGSDNKRKREEDDEPKQASRPISARNAQTQKDILDILQQYDLRR